MNQQAIVTMSAPMNFPIIDSFGLSRAQWLARTLEQGVTEHGLEPGARLGTKRDLRERYQVAAGTVNEALRMLEARGLVTSRPGPGGGVFVADIAGPPTTDLLMLGFRWQGSTYVECHEVRGALEPLVGVQAARHRTRADLRDLDRVLRQMSEHTSSPTDYIHSNWSLHRRLGAVGRNSLLQVLYATLIDFLEERFDEGEMSASHCEASLSIHADLVEAIRSRDEDRVTHAIQLHEEHIAGHLAVTSAMMRPARATMRSSGGAVLAREIEGGIIR